MEDGDMEKYHPSSVIQDFVFFELEKGLYYFTLCFL